MSTRESGVLDPVDGHLQNAHAGPLRDDQQLGVEEPSLVVNQGHEVAGNLRAHRLESALRIAKPRVQHATKQKVVSARDELTSRAPADPRSRGEPAADGDVGAPREDGRNQCCQRLQPCREVDVHVRDDVRITRQPGAPERPAATLFLKVDAAHAVQQACEPHADEPSCVVTRVVDDGDPRGEWNLLVDKCVQRAHALLQDALLVVHGDRNVQDRRACRGTQIVHETSLKPPP